MANQKHWSYKTGEKGRNRVRAYEDSTTGKILLEYWRPDTGKRRRISTGHTNRKRAKQQADKLAAEIGSGLRVEARSILLRELFDNYLREVTPGKSASKQAHDRRAAKMFLAYLGSSREARSLNRRDWGRFIRERRSGRCGPDGRPRAKGVGDRQVAYDLKFLLAVLNWATLVSDGQGGVILDRNPLKGLPLPKEESPKRPIVSEKRYQAMLEVAPRVDWRLGLALVLAHETGHRINSIRKLRWSDVDLDRSSIRWRAEADKIGYEHVTPISPAATAALQGSRQHNPAIGDAWVFPAPKDRTKPCSRHLMRKWWLRAEKLAELDHIKGLGWHGLRRKFATDLMQTAPLKVLSSLGGWKEPQTILKCYQLPDQATMRQALQEREARRAGGEG